ncbi:NAD(P)-dependent oxidoreductase [Falsiporphyromonas endometrii]|uniref:NAD(P)-dependent oxidoreductase n=1 Tax=Falsiporphyromonas endometrii TaxID=1387297 RepID=A0ABV9K704_9PORP
MAKVLIATEKPFAPVAVKGIRKIVEEAGFELNLLEKYTEKSQLLTAIADVDAVIIRSDKIDAEVLDAAKNLKIVVRAGAGYDNVDCEAAKAHNVCVMNTPGQNSNAVAELCMGLIIYGLRNFYNGASGRELAGKKVGILAYGYIGKLVAKYCKAFGCEVYAYHPRRTDEQIKADGVIPTHSQEELFEKCDIVSVHTPSRPENKGCVNYACMSKIREKGIILNTARKEVFNEEDLIKVMNERTDIKYITDIQPACHEKMVAEFEGRYYATPKKMGAQTAEANINAGLAAANQIVKFIKNGDETFRVN